MCSPSPLLLLSSLQSGYHECVEAMLTPYPGEVDLLIQLVSTEKIPETKALSLMEYLCNASTYLLTCSACEKARQKCFNCRNGAAKVRDEERERGRMEGEKKECDGNRGRYTACV